MPNYEERLTKAFDRRCLRPNTQLAYRKIIRRLRDFHATVV